MRLAFSASRGAQDLAFLVPDNVTDIHLGVQALRRFGSTGHALRDDEISESGALGASAEGISSSATRALLSEFPHLAQVSQHRFSRCSRGEQQ
mmetsp:Transcript_24981/g.83374  ORF Transcript_24981/g.83374 Transcript_24981/m.83374 type:complete len:93 (+) Transcript_24981:1105-1383(+)